MGTPMSEPTFRAIFNQNQLRTIRQVARQANWPMTFDLGNPRGDMPEGEELYRGRIVGSSEGEIIALRSQDMIDNIAEGRFDFAAIGSDVVEEFFNHRFIELGRIPVGRKLPPIRPRLELAALATSKVSNPEEIPDGSIVMSERERITKKYFEDRGRRVLVKSPHEDMLEFREKVMQPNTIGIRLILGTGPVQLEPYAPDSYFLIMVNEEGSTINDYHLKVIDKIRDIDTVFLTTERSMTSDQTRGSVLQLARELEQTFFRIKGEYEASGQKERQ